MDRPWLHHLAVAMTPWQGRGVIVAVSGGGDSVALLRGLADLRHEANFRLSVATLDHNTRAGGSAADAEFVADLAARHDLPFDRGHWQSERPGHFEADARRARYGWLLEVARRRGAAAVAVGHTRDDQAETILHRIIRGTGLTGLAGMAPRRPLGPGVALIRPVLAASRADLRAYLGSIGQEWRNDASNDDQGRTRARLRHDLLPRLAHDYNPNVADALIHLGQAAASAATAANRRASRRLARLTLAQDQDQITLDRPALRELPRAERVDLIRLAWRRLGWPEGRMDHARWLRLASHAGDSTPKRIDVAAGIEAVATPELWTLRRRPAPSAGSVPAPQRLPIPGSADWLGGRLSATLDQAATVDERVDFDQVVGPLIVRGNEAGDRFDPLGMAGHSQPLADFFRSRRISRTERATVPLVADARGIIWVAGHRIAHRVRRTDDTVRTLGLRHDRPVNPPAGEG